MSPLIDLKYTQKEREEQGSKYIALPIDPTTGKAKVGGVVIRTVECGMPDWYTAGISIKFPVTVVEAGIDKGKESELYCGIGAKASFKMEEAAAAFGVPEAITYDAKGNAQLNPDLFPGKRAKGVWVGTETNATPPSVIAKLTNFISVTENSAPEVEELI